MTNIKIKQTAYHNQYTRLKIVDTSQGDRAIIVPSPWGYRRVTVRCQYDFIGPARPSCGNLAGSLRLSEESTIIFWAKNDNLKSCVIPTTTVLGSYGVTAMCLRATGLRFFQICHCAELNKIATMPVNPYDDRKVSLRRANVTEA